MNYYSSRDMLGLVAEINCRRMPKVMGTKMKRSGVATAVMNPRDKELMMHARQMHNKFLRGNYRHTENDEAKLKNLMDLLVVTWADLQGHEPRMDYAWDCKTLRQPKPIRTRYAYIKAMQGLAEW